MAKKQAAKKAIKKMVITKITHYAEDDEDGSGDYYSVELRDAAGNIIAEFGDYYHDKGDVKADAFVDGMRYVLGKDNVEVVEKQVADS